MDMRPNKKEFVRRKGRSEEDKEEEILEMINQFFEPYDYTRFDLDHVCFNSRHQGNPQVLENLTKEIRRVSMNEAVTPGSTPTGSYIPDTPCSRASTGHDSSSSVPPMPQLPVSYRSQNSPSPTLEDRAYQHYPSQSARQTSYSQQQSYPHTIRPPPAVARLAGKEKKKNNNISNGYTPPLGHPTSHPTTTSPAREHASMLGIMSWGKKDKDTRSEKWESGVIGRERARVIISNNKRHYPT
jgi:hypothetical protein